MFFKVFQQCDGERSVHGFWRTFKYKFSKRELCLLQVRRAEARTTSADEGTLPSVCSLPSTQSSSVKTVLQEDQFEGWSTSSLVRRRFAPRWSFKLTVINCHLSMVEPMPCVARGRAVLEFYRTLGRYGFETGYENKMRLSG